MMDDVRAEFERWAKANINPDVDRFNDKGAWPGQYNIFKVQVAWESWKAAMQWRDDVGKGVDNGR